MHDSVYPTADELREEIAKNAEEGKLLRRMLRAIEDRDKLMQRRASTSTAKPVEVENGTAAKANETPRLPML